MKREYDAALRMLNEIGTNENHPRGYPRLSVLHRSILANTILHESREKIKTFEDLQERTNTMNEIIFLVEETDNNKYTATAMGRAIVIEAHSWNESRSLAKNSTLDFFRNGKHPQSILLHLVREEIITL